MLQILTYQLFFFNSTSVTCQGTHTTPVYNEGEIIKIETSQRLADVVFVVREGDCQKDLPSYFPQLVNQLNRNFNQVGLRVWS